MARLPDEPHTRLERYLARLAGQDVTIPDTPITRIECYLAYLIENGGGAAAPNAGGHNSIFRGKSLGSAPTSAQMDAIDAGTFDDIFIGDYWESGGVRYRVAGIDTYYTIGSVPLSKHHLVLVPDTTLYLYQYNAESTTAGGYAGSLIKTSGLADALSTVRGVFGDMVLTRYSLITTGVGSGGVPSGWGWQEVNVSLMSEGQVLGRGSWGTQASNGYNVGDLYNQLPLFHLMPQYIKSDKPYWLQDIRMSGSVSIISFQGVGSFTTANNETTAVRPYFCIGKAS